MSVAPLRVRDSGIEDVDKLVAWNAAMARETEAKALDLAVLERGVRAVFAEPRRGRYLVAELDGKPVGGLLLTFEWSDWRDGDFWWIQSVYVVPAARRRGIFRALYAEVEARAAASAAVGIRLYVERDNQAAQTTYRDLGMHECAYRMYQASLPTSGSGR